MFDITVGIAAAKSTMDLVKAVKDLDHALDRADLKNSMAEIYSNLADVKVALADAQLELQQKDSQIAALQESNDYKKSLIEIDGFKYDQKDGEPIGLPYCPTCEVKEGKLFRLSNKNDNFSVCSNCKNSHNAALDGRVNHRPAPISRTQNKWIRT